MQPYDQEYNMDESLLRKIISEQVPDLDIKSINKLGEGWDNNVYKVNNKLLFRVPRRKQALRLLDLEEKSVTLHIK